MKRLTLMILLLFFTFSLLSAKASAAEPASPGKLSLKDAIMLAVRSNPSIRSQEIQRTADKFALLLAKNEFQFKYSLGGSTSYSEGVGNGGPVSRSQQSTLNPGISIKSKLGTTYSLTWNNSYTYSKDDPYAWNPEVKLEISQPLMRGSSPKIVTASLTQAILSDLNSRLSTKNTVITQINKVMSDYRSIIQNKLSIIIAKQSIKIDEQNLKQYKAEIKAGKKAPADINDVKTNLFNDKLNLITTQNSLETSKQTLLTDLGLNPYAKIDVYDNVSVDDIKIPKVKNSIKQALKSNISYQQNLIALENDKISLMTNLDAARWKLDLSASVSVGGGSGGAYNGNYQSLFNGSNSNKSVSLNLDIPIDDMSIKNGIVSARSALQQEIITVRQAKWQLETSIINQIRTLKTDKSQIELAQQQLLYAQKSYNVARKKVSVGQSTAFELTSKATSLRSAKQTLLNNKITFLNDYANFDAFLAHTLQTWRLNIAT